MEKPSFELNNGISIPAVGLGTYKLTGPACVEIVERALELGYRHIDTADYYGNHAEIGRTIKKIKRDELFLTSKIWSTDLAYDDCMKAAGRILQELDTTYLDLLLIHWPNEKIALAETYKAFAKLYSQKKIRSIGVSNFTIRHLEESKNTADLPVAVNQVEFHPLFNRERLHDYCAANNIMIKAYCPVARGLVNKNKIICSIAEKHRRTPAQISLRWLIQKNIIAIPKAGTYQHLAENISVFDFSLSDMEMKLIDGIGEKHRLVNIGDSED